MVPHTRAALVAVLLLLVTGTAQARLLQSAAFTFLDAADQPLTTLTDGALETASTLVTDDQPVSVTIDLQAPYLLHRLYWVGNRAYRGEDTPPVKRVDDKAGTISVFVGDSLAQMTRVAMSPITAVQVLAPAEPDGDAPAAPQALLNGEADNRFPLTSARYVRLVAEKAPANFTWILGEIELYGFDAAQTKARDNAVVVPVNAAPALNFAAAELSYYLGELTGKPHPVIPADADVDAYTGTLYRIDDLTFLAPTYAAMRKNQQAGLLPAETVNIERKGREVIFRSWPYRNVIVSVWEFLERQGVRWTYPDPHGESVPARDTVALDFLPLHATPPVTRNHANFDVSRYLYGMPWHPWPLTQGYLYFWRNRWTSSWNTFPYFSGAEVPKLAGRYREFCGLAPNRLY